MKGLRRIISNTLISLFGQMVTWASSLILMIAYGRFLGDIKFGELYFAITLVSLVGIPVEDGFNPQLTRDVAEAPEKALDYLWNTLLIKILLWVLAYTGVILVAWALGYGQEQRDLVTICGITLLSGSIVNTFASLHYAFERTLFPSLGMILEKGVSASIGFILLKNGATVQTMALILLGGSLLDAIWQALWFFRLVGWRPSLSKATIHKLVKSSIPFVVYAVLGVIYYRIDTILLSLMTGTAAVGWYGAAYRLFDTLLFVPNLILNAVMYPVFARLSEKSQEGLQVAIEKCMNFLLICAFPIAALMVVSAPNIIGFLYHQADFDNSIPVVQALAPGLIFLYINTLLSSVIVSIKREKKIPLMAAIALVFNLSMNLVCIPLYQQIGAAFVTSLTELLLLCISCLFLPKHLLPIKSLKVGGKVLLATFFMAGMAWLLKTFTIVLILPIALLAYGGMLLLFKAIPAEDLQALRQAIRQKSRGTLAEGVTDETIQIPITDRLPIVTTPMLQGQVEEPLDDDITERLPAIKLKRMRQHMEAVREAALEDDDITQLLPAVKLKRAQLAGEFQQERAER